MKQWFTGRFRGHYRGKLTESSQLAQYAEAEHFSIEVYEALVSDIELGPLVAEQAPLFEAPPESEALDEEEEPPSQRKTVVAERKPGDTDAPPSQRKTVVAPTPSERDAPLSQRKTVTGPPPPEIIITAAHHEARGNVLHQSHIGKVHLIDPLKQGQTLRSTVHDVLMGSIELSHGAKSQKGTLGHIEGTISGWFKPPHEPEEVQEVSALEGPPPVGWRTETVSRGVEAPLEQEDSKDVGTSNQAKSAHFEVHDSDSEDDDLEEEEDLEAALEREEEEESPTEYPFFSLGMAITVLLGFFATPFAATLFGLTFLFSYAIRRWLLGVVPEASAIRVLALFIGTTQILVAALLIARWSTIGCVSLSPFPLFWLLGAQMVASLLPRPLPFALTTAGFAAVLFQAYGSWAPPLCSAPKTQEEPAPISSEMAEPTPEQ